jgi:hypothetical protein
VEEKKEPMCPSYRVGEGRRVVVQAQAGEAAGAVCERGLLGAGAASASKSDCGPERKS